MKKWLDIKFYSAGPHPEKPVIKSKAVGNKFENHIRVDTADDIRPGLFVYIRQSYELMRRKRLNSDIVHLNEAERSAGNQSS